MNHAKLRPSHEKDHYQSMSQVIEPEIVLDPSLASFKPRVCRQYSREDRLKAVSLYDTLGSLEKASEHLGIPLSTLAGWCKDDSDISEARKQNQAELSKKLKKAADTYLDLALKKAKKAPFNHLMTAVGISVDKFQLLDGQPTSINQSVISDEERQVKMAEIFSRLEARAIEAQSDVKPAELASADPEE